MSLMLTLGASLATMPLAAMPSGVREQAEHFASCLGRFSAAMEHEWLMGRDGADALESRRLFESLLEAVQPDARAEGLSGSDILHLRIEAKFAQARLMQLAAFSDDDRRARHARLRATHLLGNCQSLVFG
ncbi:hypothetical protein [Pacificoceanicola onchidii]|uniref:hypothetical protein n=1 Tax=Pacificoceanicola onchidii TaxID=2562685 RepID=UPI00145604E1|nr:hypothetical protein [Pacificoceanicola onchidii]